MSKDPNSLCDGKRFVVLFITHSYLFGREKSTMSNKNNLIDDYITRNKVYRIEDIMCYL